MYYELYIDIFFLENFMMDSLILFAVKRMIRSGSSHIRILCGGIAGSLLTCLWVVVPFPAVVKMAGLYIGISSVMLLITFPLSTVREFVKEMLLLYTAAVFLGGIMGVLRPYMRFVSFFYASAALGYVILIQLWKMLSFFQRRQERIIGVTLYGTDGTQVDTEALWDTGNHLRDFVTGDPVCVMTPALASRLSSSLQEERGYHMIPYHCVGGDDVMEVFRIEKMCVHMERNNEEADSWIRKPLLGIGKGELSSQDEYDMILNPDIFL